MLNANDLDRIQVTMRTDEIATGTVIHESVSDHYILSSPLSRGNAKIECEGRVLLDGIVRPGMLRILSPGERITITKRSRREAVDVAIPANRFRQLQTDDNLARGRNAWTLPRMLAEPSFQVEAICRSFLSLPELADQYRQLFVDGLACALLAILLSEHQSGPERDDLARKGRLTDAQLNLCLEYADSRMAERLGLSEWANTLGMSTSEFARRFQQKTGVAPYAWFMNWRIDRAKLLLKQQRLTVVEVALEVGFCSQSHFTEAFRRRVGVSPARWRAQQRAAG